LSTYRRSLLLHGNYLSEVKGAEREDPVREREVVHAHLGKSGEIAPGCPCGASVDGAVLFCRYRGVILEVFYNVALPFVQQFRVLQNDIER
jgi:hypothetical protein